MDFETTLTDTEIRDTLDNLITLAADALKAEKRGTVNRLIDAHNAVARATGHDLVARPTRLEMSEGRQ